MDTTRSSRRSTICSACDVERDVKALRPSEGIYAIAYEGKRKQKSLAHIFRNTFQQHSELNSGIAAQSKPNTIEHKSFISKTGPDCINLNDDSTSASGRSGSDGVAKLQNFKVSLIVMDDFSAEPTDQCLETRTDRHRTDTNDSNSRELLQSLLSLAEKRSTNEETTETKGGTGLVTHGAPKRRRSFAAVVKEHIIGVPHSDV